MFQTLTPTGVNTNDVRMLWNPTRFCENGYTPNRHPEWASALSILVFYPCIARALQLQLYATVALLGTNMLSSMSTHLSQGMAADNLFFVTVDYIDVVTTVLILTVGLAEIAARIVPWLNAGIIAVLAIVGLATQGLSDELSTQWSGSVVAALFTTTTMSVYVVCRRCDGRGTLTLVVAGMLVVLAACAKLLADEPGALGLPVDEHGCNAHTASWAHALWHLFSGLAVLTLLGLITR